MPTSHQMEWLLVASVGDLLPISDSPDKFSLLKHYFPNQTINEDDNDIRKSFCFTIVYFS
jgi:hypothetical protein